jgi:outer membrane protein assembly factor BamB
MAAPIASPDRDQVQSAQTSAPAPQTKSASAPAPAGPLPFRKLWSVPLDGSPTSAPAYSGNQGFFAIDDRLAAHDLTSGALQWSVPRTTQVEPATGDGLLFLIADNTIIALRQMDGSMAWQRELASPLAAPLAWNNGWLIVPTKTGEILAYRALDGGLIWRRGIEAAASARPSLAADRVYVPASDGRIVAFQTENGEVVWDRRIGGKPHEILALDDRVYVGSTDNRLYCLKTDSGVIDWRWPTGADVVGQPVEDARLVFFVSLDNMLRALDRRSGNQRWKRALPLRPSSGPRRAGDALIVSGVAPPLRVYQMKDGSPAGEIATDGELAFPPHVVPNADVPTVIVVTWSNDSGALLAAFSRASAPEPEAVKDPQPDPKTSDPQAADPKPPDPRAPVPPKP